VPDARGGRGEALKSRKHAGRVEREKPNGQSPSALVTPQFHTPKGGQVVKGTELATQALKKTDLEENASVKKGVEEKEGIGRSHVKSGQK